MNPSSSPQERRVGPDLLRVEGDVLAIYSPRDMPDWVVREFCRPAICFQGHKFFLLAKESIRGAFRWKYSLCLWREDDPHSTPYTILYSDEYVAERERDRLRVLASQSATGLLRPMFPVLGFLWSGTKERLERLGFPARTITSASVTVEFGMFMLLGVFVAYLGYWSPRNLLTLAVLGLDLVMRYDAVLGDRPRQFGFLEWCFRR